MLRYKLILFSLCSIFSCGGSKDDHDEAKLEEKEPHEVQSEQKLVIGSEAPGFSLHNPAGDLVSLADFRGKYLFLDFWASWCQPCRKENPDLMKVYNHFKDQNFEILGIALDKKKDKWMYAIEADGLEWPQVSDLKYFDSEIIELYNIQSVPTTILLDPEGKIIAKNLHAKDLENLLSEIF